MVTVTVEACYLTPKTLAPTLDHVSPLKAGRGISFPKRNFTPFVNTSSRLPSVACCFNSSSLRDESGEPVMDSDWRSYRARLVAGENALRREESAPDSWDNHPPRVTLAKKWAHPIHEPERGCVLMATEKLDGVHIFEKTAILLLSTGPLRPTGIILNRPSLMSIKEMRSTALDVDGTFSGWPLFFGGPLEDGLFLVSPKGDDDEEVGKSEVFEEVMKGLYYGRRESVGCAAEMVKRKVVGVGDLRFFDGYCGWETDQLKDEIKAGYWTVVACSPSVISLDNVGSGRLWEEILGLMGERKVW
ncbi:uncharacterized protein [Aristolochia californica]|uniref:uncharacterized protein n=1 Tax=Aristolochia californica TaxID=171875 RepID=UPI0035E1CBB9